MNRIVVGLGAVFLAMGVGCRKQDQPTPTAPKTESATIVDSTQSATATNYVADTTCAECHADISARYANHPMAHSLAPVTDRKEIEVFDAASNAIFNEGPFQYQATLNDRGEMIHRRQLLPLTASPKLSDEFTIDLVVGSGQKGRSYLLRRDDFLFMSPLTWYPDQGQWDLSPGYHENDLGFQRVVLDDCLFCHSNGAVLLPNSKNHYDEPTFPRGHAIGCQRCHGPGEHHVQARQNDDLYANREIVNPGGLAPDLREAVCQQCHLAGVARVVRAGRSRYDYRPGQPLDSAIVTFALNRPQSEEHFVGQVEQMYASSCFQASEGQLGCISCHDPHSVPSRVERESFYRQRCLECHSIEGTCSAPLEQRIGSNDCVACHMPPIATDVRHAAATDHRIPRWKSTVPKASARSRSPHAIHPFPPRRTPDDSLDATRDLAIGTLQAAQYYPQQVVSSHLTRLRRSLQQAIQRNPLDFEGSDALGDLNFKLGNREGFTQYRTVLRHEPNREHAMVQLAAAAGKGSLLDESLELWERANRLNPTMASYRLGWGKALGKAGQWRRAEELLDAATKEFPTNEGLWHLFIETKLRRNAPQAAAAGLAILVRLNPDSEATIRTWFADHAYSHKP